MSSRAGEQESEGYTIPVSPLLSPRYRFGSLSSVDSDDGSKSFQQPSKLTMTQKASFSVGHVMNDMMAACWFTYLLVMLQEVEGLSSSQSGIVLFTGQLSDAVFTVLSGMLQDTSKGCCNMGRRKFYHFGGTLVTAICFLLVFSFSLPRLLLPVSSLKPPLMVSYYAVAGCLFNSGWSAVQVSHMSLVTELEESETHRTGLNSARFGMTVFSNIVVFGSLWMLIYPLDIAEEERFKILGLICVGFGMAANLFFHAGTQEPKENEAARNSKDRVTAKDWLNFNPFWQIALTYTCSRLVVNVSSVYIPFFVTKAVKLESQYITLCPMATYVSSLIASAAMKRINEVLGRKRTFAIGFAVVAASLTWFRALDESTQYWTFGACVLLGFGSATIMVCATQLLADLVHTYTESAAFVYGGISFVDKFTNGITILIIQQINDGSPQAVVDCLTIAPACALGLSLIILFFVPNIEDMNTMERKRKRRWAGMHSAAKLAQGAISGAQAAQLLLDTQRGDRQMQLAAAHQAQGIAGLMALASLLEAEGVHRSAESAQALQAMRQAVSLAANEAKRLASTVKQRRHLRQTARRLEDMSECLLSASQSVHLAEAAIANYQLAKVGGGLSEGADALASFGADEGDEGDAGLREGSFVADPRVSMQRMAAATTMSAEARALLIEPLLSESNSERIVNAGSY